MSDKKPREDAEIERQWREESERERSHLRVAINVVLRGLCGEASDVAFSWLDAEVERARGEFDEQHAASPPPVAPPSVPDYVTQDEGELAEYIIDWLDARNGAELRPAFDAMDDGDVATMADELAWILHHKGHPPNWVKPEERTVSDDGAPPEPLPEPEVRCTECGEVIDGGLTRVYALPIAGCFHKNCARVAWHRHKASLAHPQADPPAIERVEGMQSEAKGLDGVVVKALACRSCGVALRPENRFVADGCPCNAPRGINHGLVAKETCTCDECDPEQTGSARQIPPEPPWTDEQKRALDACFVAILDSLPVATNEDKLRLLSTLVAQKHRDPKPPAVARGEGGEDEAYALIRSVRDIGPSGGTMVEFPFEELHKRVAEAIAKARSEGYEQGKAEGEWLVLAIHRVMAASIYEGDSRPGRSRVAAEAFATTIIQKARVVANQPAETKAESGGEGEATDEELERVHAEARDKYRDNFPDDNGEAAGMRAIYNLGLEHGKRAGGGAKEGKS